MSKLAALLLLSGFLAPTAGISAQPPNFILICADDLGYGDLGCYGSKSIATPALDRMAREGIRFTDAYAAAPFCSPSRAALLTGRLPARAGLPYVLFPAEHHGLPEAEITLAELLRQRGYATACIGKWHLGWAPPFRPLRQGFDEFFGTPYSNDSNEWPVGAPFMQVMGLVPFPLIDGSTTVEAPADPAQLTRRYTERAVAFIRTKRERPFFLYLPHTMPHVPQYASSQFEGRSPGGLYADTVAEVDWSTGVILETLRELGLAENTLVAFTSDNGAPHRGPNAGQGQRAGKKAAVAVRFPGRNLAGSNGTLRGGKGTTFEGGIRVPFIAWRPGTLPAGRVSDAVVSHLDLFPTIAGQAGSALPRDRTYDGHDLGADLSVRARTAAMEPIFHYFGHQLQALRLGPWKLFVQVERQPEPRPRSLWYDHQPALFQTHHRLLAAPELYDLSRDPSEQQNVAEKNPEVVMRLTKLAREFDRKLRDDARPMQVVDGPPAPAPQSIRTPETDLSAWRSPR